MNALLEGTEKEKIKHIEYVDTKLSDIETVDDKIGILDVRVVTEKAMLTDMLEIHFVELPKFLEEQPALNSSLNKWLAFLTKPEMKGEVEMAKPAIRKAITVLDMLSRDPETVRLAEPQMKQILDEKSMVEGAREEGKVEGMEEERKEEKIEIARKLLDLLDIETIAEKTGLTVEEVKKLK